MSQLDALLDAVGGAPCLPGARCRGRHHLFDERASGEEPEVVAARHGQALGLCGRCPSLQRCGDWFDALPKSKRPLGVVAGRVNHRPPVGRPKAAS